MANVGTAAAGKTLIGGGIGASPTFASIGTNCGLSAHGVVLGQGNSPFNVASPSTSGAVLASNGSTSDPSFQSIGSLGGITSITGDSGGAEIPLAGNFNILGTGSITIAGSANTETVQLTGLTNHAIQIGAGTATLTQLATTATTGQILQSQGSSSDPAYSTATYPSSTTVNQIFYSSSNNVVDQITAVNDGVLVTSNTGVPSFLANSGTPGFVLTANSGAPPSWQASPVPPSVAESYVTNDGTAVPSGNVLNVLGTTVAAHSIPLETTGSGNTVTVVSQYSSSAASSIADNAGLASFDSAEFNVDANGYVTLTASDDLHTAKYIVGDTSNGANYSTISAALAAAPDGAIVYLQEGFYIENLTISKTVYVCSLSENNNLNNSATVDGSWTITAAVNLNLCGVGLTNSSGGYIITTTTASAQSDVSNCFINVQSGVGFNLDASGTNLYMIECSGQVQSGAQFASITIGNFWFWYCEIGVNGTQVTSTIAAAGALDVRFCTTSISFITASTGIFNVKNSTFDTSGSNVIALTTVGTGINVIDKCIFSSGSASAISIGSGTTVDIIQTTVNSSNTNPITGSGTLNYAEIVYTNTSACNVTTQNPYTVQLGNVTPPLNQQVFLSSGSYTPTQGMTYCIIEMIGAGGGGGGSAAATSNYGAGGGGGAGQYGRAIFSAATIAAALPLTVTVGTPGAGGTAGNNAGSPGTASSVGSLISAGGGGGGTGSTAASNAAHTGGTGGTGGSISGQQGSGVLIAGAGGAQSLIVGATYSISGAGGCSFFGGYGISSISLSTNSKTGNAAVANSGSGGSGAETFNSSTAAAGGNGGDGLVIITEYL